MMAKPYKIPYFEKLYPDASKEVIHVLKTTERKNAIPGIRPEKREMHCRCREQ